MNKYDSFQWEIAQCVEEQGYEVIDVVTNYETLVNIIYHNIIDTIKFKKIDLGLTSKDTKASLGGEDGN